MPSQPPIGASPRSLAGWQDIYTKSLDCVHCGMCLPACPIGAIVASEDVDPTWARINAELAPEFETNPPVARRPRYDSPRKPGHVIVNP